MRDFLNGLLDAVWPRQCHHCNAPGAMGLDLCVACAARLPWMPAACIRCALPLAEAHLACECVGDDTALDGAYAAFLYRAPVDRWVPRLKFHGDLGVGRLLGELMVEGLAHAPRPNVLVPIPLHRPRLRERGYNQALELARPMARLLDLPLQAGLLLRLRQTRAQSELGLAERAANLAGAFSVPGGAKVPAHVVLVDDVMTTGATLDAAARALKAAGAVRVDAWLCARTPRGQNGVRT